MKRGHFGLREVIRLRVITWLNEVVQFPAIQVESGITTLGLFCSKENERKKRNTETFRLYGESEDSSREIVFTIKFVLGEIGFSLSLSLLFFLSLSVSRLWLGIHLTCFALYFITPFCCFLFQFLGSLLSFKFLNLEFGCHCSLQCFFSFLFKLEIFLFVVYR